MIFNQVFQDSTSLSWAGLPSLSGSDGTLSGRMNSSCGASVVAAVTFFSGCGSWSVFMQKKESFVGEASVPDSSLTSRAWHSMQSSGFMPPKNSSKREAGEVALAAPPVEVRRSGVHGKGVYATAPIRKGARIIEYTGRHLPWKEAMDLPPHRPDEPYHTFFFSLNNGEVIDAGRGGNAARWINHSCAPNCETTEENDRIFVDALRAIRPGEELFYDYRIVPADRRTKALEKEYVCLCGAPQCRGTMLEPRPRRKKKRPPKKSRAGAKSARG